MSKRAMLCPRCRRLIGSEEDVCSWCGTSRSASWWHLVAWSQGAAAGDVIVKTLISANIAYYVFALLISSRTGGVGDFISPGQTSLLLLGATGTYPIDRFGRIWTVLSANYLHSGIIHLLFNLMALNQLAAWVSREFGSSRMLIIYTLGGVGGYVVSYAAGIPVTVGASAAVCSLIGALLYYGKSRGGSYGSSVYREVGGWAISLFVFGLLSPGINNWGHGGGIVSGVLIAALLGYAERRREGIADHALALLCAFVTGAVLVWAAVVAYVYS